MYSSLSIPCIYKFLIAGLSFDCGPHTVLAAPGKTAGLRSGRYTLNNSSNLQIVHQARTGGVFTGDEGLAGDHFVDGDVALGRGCPEVVRQGWGFALALVAAVEVGLAHQFLV